MLEGNEERRFKASPQTSVGWLLQRYFSSINKSEEAQYYALFFNGQPQDKGVMLTDPLFGEQVHFMVKEAPRLRRNITVTAVNVLTGAQEQADHCFDVPTDVRQCVDVRAMGCGEE